MAKRKETVTVRAWGIIGKYGTRPITIHTTRAEANEELWPGEKIVPCTITYTKPGGKNGELR